MTPSKVSPRRVGDHEPGRHPTGEQRGQHRAGRGADDHLGARRVPAGLLGDRIERADQPGPTLDPAGAKDEPDLHRRDANRCRGGCERGDACAAAAGEREPGGRPRALYSSVPVPGATWPSGYAWVIRLKSNTLNPTEGSVVPA